MYDFDYEDYLDSENHESYIGWRVKVKSSDKTMYNKVIGKSGTVTRQSGGSIGVEIDGQYNKASGYGVYWFGKNELKFLKNESEDIKMADFGYVAIVNLLEDYNKKDYAFAFYEEDWKLGNFYDGVLVVVNARGKNNRQLGVIKKIMTVKEYYSVDKNRGTKITAEVVGVVNMDGYIARETEKVRLEELAKKKAAIEAELEKEINKRKSIEYYEEMAKQYSDNPRLAELVGELRGLGA